MGAFLVHKPVAMTLPPNFLATYVSHGQKEVTICRIFCYSLSYDGGRILRISHRKLHTGRGRFYPALGVLFSFTDTNNGELFIPPVVGPFQSVPS